MSNREIEFWQAFSAEAPAISAMVVRGDLRSAFDRIDLILNQHGFDFCFELTEENSEVVLSLTPEGDTSQALRIDRLMRLKPMIRGWQIYGRRQRKSLHDAYAFARNIYDLDLRDATFNLLSTPNGYEVTMYSEAIAGLSEDERIGLVATFLDHAVGEDVVMARVAKVAALEGRGPLTAAALVTTLIDC